MIVTLTISFDTTSLNIKERASRSPMQCAVRDDRSLQTHRTQTFRVCERETYNYKEEGSISQI